MSISLAISWFSSPPKRCSTILAGRGLTRSNRSRHWCTAYDNSSSRRDNTNVSSIGTRCRPLPPSSRAASSSDRQGPAAWSGRRHPGTARCWPRGLCWRARRRKASLTSAVGPSVCPGFSRPSRRGHLPQRRKKQLEQFVLSGSIAVRRLLQQPGYPAFLRLHHATPRRRHSSRSTARSRHARVEDEQPRAHRLNHSAEPRLVTRERRRRTLIGL